MKLELILALAAGFGAAPYLDNPEDIAPMSPAPVARLTPQSEPVPSAEANFSEPLAYPRGMPDLPAIDVSHMDELEALPPCPPAPAARRQVAAAAPRPRLKLVPWIAQRSFGR